MLCGIQIKQSYNSSDNITPHIFSAKKEDKTDNKQEGNYQARHFTSVIGIFTSKPLQADTTHLKKKSDCIAFFTVPDEGHKLWL